MIDEIDRRRLMRADREGEGDRRQPLFWLLWALLIFVVLFGCGQFAMLFGSGELAYVEVRSGLTVDYGIWTPAAFGGINPLIIAEAAGDNGGELFLASNPSSSCFLLGGCTPNPPSPTAPPTSTPTVTSTPTSTPTPTNTPTVTNTLPPTFTHTPVYTPTNTPTPTPLVYPIKIANPGNIPPGPTTLQFSIIVINYGSIPPAHLTAVIDRLPPGMSYNSGCVPACGASPGDTTITWNVDEWIPQSGFSRFRFIANADGAAGEIFLNEVETQGGNFETSTNVKRVYVYTPTPTSTPMTAPVANDDPNGAPATTYITNEDIQLSIGAPGLLANDTDAPWDTLSAFPLGAPSNGTAAINADGSFTYTPNANFFGSDSFTYEACDGGPLCDSATVYITVNSVEDTPVANDDPTGAPASTYVTNEDIPLSISAPGILANDSDGDNIPPANPWDNLTVNLLPATGPANAAFYSWNPDGSFSYTPVADYNGPDQFQYEVCDLTLRCDTATVFITVNSVNDPPVAVDDPENLADPSYTTDEDVPFSIDVMANDSDPVEGDPLSISGFPGAPSHGTLAIDLNGTPGDPTDDLVRYTPSLHYFGNDSFTYQISDGNGGFATAVVRVLVNPINDAPTAVDDTASMGAFDPPLAIYVMANDADLVEGEPLQIVSVQSLTDQGGTAFIHDNFTPLLTDDYIVYDPQGYSHPTIADTFTYTISDGQPFNNTDTAIVSVIVNDPPDAVDDPYSVDEDNDLIVPGLPGLDTLLDNDSDLNSDPLVSALTSPPSDGVLLAFGADGSFTYRSNVNFNGTDSFTYDACDDLLAGLCDSALVTVTVNAVNDDPVALDDSMRANRNTPTDFDVLANDSDVDLDVLLVSNATDGAHGTVTNNGTDVTYDPDWNYEGSDSFSYTASDGNGGTATATVTVLVSGSPTALDESYSTLEDTLLVVAAPGVLLNDTDPNPTDTLSAVILSTTPDGTLVLSSDGSFTYTPDLNFNGNDQFTYEACDPGGLCDPADVTITVISDNDPPTANPDNGATDEDTSVTINLVANDTDVDGTVDSTSVFISSSPGFGWVQNHGDGTITFHPSADFLAIGDPPLVDTFTYTVDDNNGFTSSPGTVTVIITPVNDPPVAKDDDRETGQDVTRTIGVLSNDYDVDNGDTISILTFDVIGSQGATITQSGSSLVFDPLPAFSDPINPETFTYTIRDSQGATDTATVSVLVNDAPVAQDDAASTPEDIAVSIDVMANDTDANGDFLEIVAGSVTSPTNGTISVNDNSTPGDRTDDFIDYTPDANFNGADSFTYFVTDGGLDSAPVTVDISISSVNDDPVAQDDSGRTNTGLPNTFDVLGNDYDVDFDPINVTSVTDGAQGTVTNNGSDVTYTPAGGYVGTDTFTYTIGDGNGGSATATVDVVVNGPPVAGDDSYSTTEDIQLVIVAPGVLGGDTDPNADALTAAINTAPTHGTLLLNADGGFTYTPDADYHGPPDDGFTYEACDPGSPSQSQLCDTGTVTISIFASPDTPVAVDDAYPVDEDSSLSVPSPGVLGNDSDGDNLTGNPWSGLSITLLASPNHADTFTLNADGSFDYVPTVNYNGSDTFDYEACDPTARCDSATVIITVNPVNDDPIALPDTASTDEDTSVVIDVLANDSDPADGDTLSVASAGGGASFGTVVNNGGNVTYIPSVEYLSVGQVQADSFTYTVSDGNGGTATATVSVDISGRNDDPVAVNDSRSMGAFDTPLSIDVLTNDFDVDAGDTVSIISFDTLSAGGGSITQSGDNLIYNPSGFHHPTNPDTFNYLIADGNGGTDSATVSILVNDPPSAADDIGIYSVDEDQTLNINAPGVLGNDIEPNGDSLTVSVISGVSHGSLSLQNDGSFMYSPSPNYYGSDGFTYQICDAPSGGTCDTATVDITINSVNDPPVAGNDSGTANQVVASTTGITIDVAANDSDLEGAVDPTTVLIQNPPSHGIAVSNGDGTVTYTLTDGHFITDSFTYTVNDDQSPTATSNAATVNITILQPVLNVVKEADPTQAGLGDTIDFFIYIWNDGPGVAYDVRLQDTLGSCFQWVGGSPSGLIGDFADGDAAVRIASARVSNTSNCDNSNTATVSSDNAVGVSDSATVTFPPAGGGSAMSPSSTSISVASTGSSTEAAIAFLIPVAMLVTPFILSWLGKAKRASRPR